MKATTTRRWSSTALLLLLASLVLGACRGPVAADPTADINAIYQQVAATLAAEQTLEAGQASTTPAASQTPWVVTATYTDTPEITATPSNTPTNTPPPATNTPQVLCYQATFVSDVTIPDGVTLKTNTNFTKTWRLRNTGSCSWTTDFKVVFSSGTNLASNSSYALPKNVAPGETVDVSVPMSTPNHNGTYNSSWMLRSANGNTFGLGPAASVAFYAQIKVSSNADAFDLDFAASYCTATWSSNAGTQLCPGSTSSANGFVTLLTNPKLENRQEDELAIWVHPANLSNGYIEGVFPSYEVQNGDHFVAWVGCLADYKDCSLRFELSYLDGSGNRHFIEDWSQHQDGQVAQIDLDLSFLKDTHVRFVLKVEVLNTTDYADAQGFWFVPSIRNP